MKSPVLVVIHRLERSRLLWSMSDRPAGLRSTGGLRLISGLWLLTCLLRLTRCCDVARLPGGQALAELHAGLLYKFVEQEAEGDNDEQHPEPVGAVVERERQLLQDGLASFHQQDQQGEVPHVETVGDHAEPARREADKRPCEERDAEEQRQHAQAERERIADFAEQVIVGDERWLVEKRPAIAELPVIIPENHDEQPRQADSQAERTQLL